MESWSKLKRHYRKLSLSILIGFMFLSLIPVRAEVFTPTLDGVKSAGEYSNANSYQIIFTDPSTSSSETGTVYTGRNTSHIHLALEMGYPAGNAKGSIAFAIHYGEKIPSTSQIIDRKGIIYFFELASDSWKSVSVDQNEKQDTRTVQNETNIDTAGAVGISQTKVFFEMSIPIVQTDAEPYDRHLTIDEALSVAFTAQRGYYNGTENTDWAFNGQSDPYTFTLASDELTLAKDEATEESTYGFELFIIGTAIVTIITLRKKRYS